MSSSSSSRQLIDSLTSHISLYHSHSNPIPNPNPNPRFPLLRWLSSLSLPLRRSLLTFTDPSFVRVLLKMRSSADAGPTLFFLLPDLPSSSSTDPSLCSRSARGLLARSTASSTALSHALLLFGSDNEEVLDSVTVSEELVGDVNAFVDVMDRASGGRFLRGEEGGLAEEWKEMEWLKDKGYYSLEEFVANRLEVALRRSWGNAGGKKGKKGKGNVVVTGESVFWRKMGCVDWWERLGEERRKKFCLGFLGKAAKTLVMPLFLF